MSEENTATENGVDQVAAHDGTQEAPETNVDQPR